MRWKRRGSPVVRSPNGRGSRFRSIRARMLAIVLIPSVALLIIGIGASSYLVYQGSQAQDWASTMQATVAPGTNFTAQIQEERRLSLIRLAGDEQDSAALAQQRQQVNTTLAGISSLSAALLKLNPAAIQGATAAFNKLFGQLPVIRQRIDANQVAPMDVYAYYDELVDVIELGLQGLAHTAPDPGTAVEESTATNLFDVADAMSRGNGLAVGAVVSGGLTADEFQEVAHQIGEYHALIQALLPRLTPGEQAMAAKLMASASWQELSTMEAALLARGPRPSTADPDPRPLPMSVADWQHAATQVTAGLLAIYSQHHAYAEGFAASTGHRTFVNSLWGGGVVLLITLIAMLVAIRLSTRLVRRLKNLRVETLDLADRRLPAIVERLRGGEQIDIEAEVPPLDFGRDEIGEVAEAFNKAQRTAVAAAAREAETRAGVNAVFLNIAHRSQVVVHRQLEVLDKAEREQEDPDQLESLFTLDHLATRARRNAENLIILGGEQPGRQWRNPVPLVEIVRSAVAETEHYRRVHTTRLPDVMMVGSVVADLIHLLAELIDNATTFSPPDSRVEIRGNRVGKGLVIEVEDQGLGLAELERERINNFLHGPPDFGVMALSEDMRLGLFVVSQLAARHGISVTLVESVYGGIRAIVLVRSSLIASETLSEIDPDELASSNETAGHLPRQRRRDLRSQQRDAADVTWSTVPLGESLPSAAGRDSLPDHVSDVPVRWPAEEPVEIPAQPRSNGHSNGHGHGHGNGNGLSATAMATASPAARRLPGCPAVTVPGTRSSPAIPGPRCRAGGGRPVSRRDWSATRRPSTTIRRRTTGPCGRRTRRAT